MVRDWGELEFKDICACWVLASTENGLNEVEFEKLITQRKKQKEGELVQLSEDLETLVSKVSKKDFELQGRIFLTAQEHQCSMREASEIITKLDEERTKEDTSSYGKISKALRTPKYGSPKESSKIEKTEKEQPQREDIEWIRSGTVKLESLKKKYRR